MRFTFSLFSAINKIVNDNKIEKALTIRRVNKFKPEIFEISQETLGYIIPKLSASQG